MALPERSRRLVPAALAVLLMVVGFLVARLPTASAGTRANVAAHYGFRQMPIAMPAGYNPGTRTVRAVNPAFERIRSWISSVGASIAMADLRGGGRADGLCVVDTRTNDVIVTYAPPAATADRFAPFVLDPAPLPMDSSMAPMGCTAGDFNADGRTDLLVNYWGRTPILYLAKAGVTGLSNASYRPVELVPTASPDGRYHGARWNTNALNVADFDGDAHPDILVANYFPDSDVLDPHGQDNVTMNSSMSNALNGGGVHLMRWYGATAGTKPSVAYVEQPNAVPYQVATGWTLAVSSADLTGDGRPEVYLANDFGKDRLLDNRSTPGHIRFTEAGGSRGPATPKSFVLGKSSFKGMGVDFADLQNNGRFDMFVSNITTPWGLLESNFLWQNQASSPQAMQTDLDSGKAPFSQQAEELGVAWSGWGWDVKTGDFDNSGQQDIVQAVGFIKGTTNRWAWLQEMAMNNDDVYTNPRMWPYMEPGDDLSGSQLFAFYARDGGGQYVNINRQLGLTTPIPSRGIATGDTRGDGLLDFAVARQWGAPQFYENTAPHPGRYLELHLYRPALGAASTPAAPVAGRGTPAYGAQVTITDSSGRVQVAQLDGGGGHSGKRSFDVHFGLGSAAGPVRARISWRDTGGGMHEQTLSPLPGQHTLQLSSTAQEVTPR